VKGLSGGQIWKAQQDVLCYRGSSSKERAMRKVIVNKGELVEFRFGVGANFRIDDQGKNLYLFLEEEDFIKNFKLVGSVFEAIRFRNENSMKEIIEARLWGPIKELDENKS
jgi:hypothetical protein